MSKAKGIASVIAGSVREISLRGYDTPIFIGQKEPSLRPTVAERIMSP